MGLGRVTLWHGGVAAGVRRQHVEDAEHSREGGRLRGAAGESNRGRRGVNNPTVGAGHGGRVCTLAAHAA